MKKRFPEAIPAHEKRQFSQRLERERARAQLGRWMLR
jgi:hypothetical protein